MARTISKRIASIDIVRGIVMIIMALDHTRDFFHITAMTGNPVDPQTTTPALFFTRWITHFCAPAFLLLSGLSAYLSAQFKTVSQSGSFLIKRGVWLIFAEVIIITLGLTFNPLYNVLILQVIWATGWSMIILGILLRVPFTVILIIGLLLFFAHDVLDYITLPQSGISENIWKILFTANGYVIPLGGNHFIGVFYTILPWTGVMLLGYCVGYWYKENFTVAKRRKYLVITGISLFVLFIILRITNLYGDPSLRQNYHETWKNIFSFLNASKYPPSLQYLCMTIGPVLIFLSLLGNVKNKWTEIVSVYGSVPFFYYILHFYILHFLLVIIFFASGHNTSQIIDTRLPFLFRPMNFGYGLLIVYIIWISTVVVLYKPCRWYRNYKGTHHQWWLRYL